MGHPTSDNIHTLYQASGNLSGYVVGLVEVEGVVEGVVEQEQELVKAVE